MAKQAGHTDHLDRKASENLKSLYAASTPKPRKAGRQSAHSWAAVARGLGFNTGFIYRVARGGSRASNKLLHALGLPYRNVLVNVCPDCGKPPLSKRHKCGDKLERNAAVYAAWLTKHAGKLAGWVAWAELENK